MEGFDPKSLTIHFASDHAGYEMKNEIKAWLRSEGFNVMCYGPHEYDPLDDYPEFISRAAHAISQKPEGARGLIFGGSGQGEAMMANRFPNVRATVYYGGDARIINLSREHNDANVLSIGARFVDMDTAKRVIWDWLHTPFSEDEKYARRIEQAEEIAQRICKKKAEKPKKKKQ